MRRSGDFIPKPKPTEIIRHEIVLGRSEKDLFESLVLTQGVKATLPPLVSAAQDPATLYLLLMAVERITGIQIPGVISSTDDALGIAEKWYNAATVTIPPKSTDREQVRNYKAALNREVENGEKTPEEAVAEFNQYQKDMKAQRRREIEEANPEIMYAQRAMDRIDSDTEATARATLGDDVVDLFANFRSWF